MASYSSRLCLLAVCLASSRLRDGAEAASLERPYPADPLWSWSAGDNSKLGSTAPTDSTIAADYAPPACGGSGQGVTNVYSCPSQMLLSADFLDAAKEDGNDGWAVYGVAGLWGSSEDYCGRCFQIKDTASDKIIIVQAADSGFGEENRFDISVSGAGGFGASNACPNTCTTAPNGCIGQWGDDDPTFCTEGMYDGPFLPYINQWNNCVAPDVGTSKTASGVEGTTIDDCLGLLTQQDPSKWTYTEATLIDTCTASIANGFNTEMPSIKYAEVQCPYAMTKVTGLRLIDPSLPAAAEDLAYTNNGRTTISQTCCKPACAWNGYTPTKAGVTIDANLTTLYSCQQDGAVRVVPQNIPPAGANKGILPMRGVNLSGAEFRGGDFGNGNLPGKFGKDYTYPDPTYGKYHNTGYFLAKGMNFFRVPFRWERLQPTRTQPLDADELARLTSTVHSVTDYQAYVLIGPHNYARYKIPGWVYPEKDPLIGSEAIPISHFYDFWARVAAEYKDNPFVIFSLMNEPHDMPTSQWIDVAQAGIDAIRSTGATNMISIQGCGWSSTWWFSDYYATDNIQMLQLRDPLNNFVIDTHNYFDTDRSGDTDICLSANVGIERANEITPWLRANGFKAIVSEFGGGTSDLCLECMDNFLNYLEDNADVFIAWAYWAAGPWVVSDTQLGEDRDLDPYKDGSDKPVWVVLDKHTGEKTAWTAPPQDNNTNVTSSPWLMYVGIAVGALVLLCVGMTFRKRHHQKQAALENKRIAPTKKKLEANQDAAGSETSSVSADQHAPLGGPVAGTTKPKPSSSSVAHPREVDVSI